MQGTSLEESVYVIYETDEESFILYEETLRSETVHLQCYNGIYYHLLRADLCTIEDYEWNEYNVSGLYDVYHDLNSELVRNQADAHKEYEYEME